MKKGCLRAENCRKEVIMKINANRWSVEKARKWREKTGWAVGCNFLPSTAINQLEMWQEESFDSETMDRELGWAASLGFNTVRVYLHDLVWSIDPVGMLERMDRFLGICDRHGIRMLAVFFDDCHYSEPRLGKQPEPVRGVHNSGWKQSPGEEIVREFHEGTVSYQERTRLKGYVQGVLRRFCEDERILLWDLYNEPGERTLEDHSAELLEATWQWASEVETVQPKSSGYNSPLRPRVNELHLNNSDVFTFHAYMDVRELDARIGKLEKLSPGRPIICTEYMARTLGSEFAQYLPRLKKKGVGAVNWGLVSGKSQTIWPWSSRKSERGPTETMPAVLPDLTPDEPETWFHDIFRTDGTPYREEEAALIRTLTAAG